MSNAAQVRHACWLPGAPTPYLHLALAFALLESTQKRLKIADVLTNMFRLVAQTCTLRNQAHPGVSWTVKAEPLCIAVVLSRGGAPKLLYVFLICLWSSHVVCMVDLLATESSLLPRSLLVLSPADVVSAVYLTTGKIAPSYEPNGELHVGEATVAAALRDATGVGAARMRTLYRDLGDLGDVAQACPRNQSTLVRVPPLTLPGLMASLKGMATDKGQGSAGRRQQVGAGWRVGKMELLRANAATVPWTDAEGMAQGSCGMCSTVMHLMVGAGIHVPCRLC
jgi:hypothetical protein